MQPTLHFGCPNQAECFRYLGLGWNKALTFLPKRMRLLAECFQQQLFNNARNDIKKLVLPNA